MGVWIEIVLSFKFAGIDFVTPCMGVWIEICSIMFCVDITPSLPVWECGLKSEALKQQTKKISSLPVWECGLK